MGKIGAEDFSALMEDKNTQTDPHITTHHRKTKSEMLRSDVIQFDDENFDSINLQSEDSIFENQTNPLLEVNSSSAAVQSVKVKTEQLELTDDEYDSENLEEGVKLPPPALVIIKTEDNDDLVCDVNPFNGGEDSEGTESKYRIHKCDQCSKCFSRATHLKRHKLTHEEGKIQCPVCDKRFTRVDHLNVHVQTNHSDSKPYQCGIAECKKGFVRQEHLKKHIEVKHGDGTKEMCDICQKTFKSKKYLRAHMKSHTTGEWKGLACKYCSKEFNDKTELNDHLSKDHQNEKPYLCSGEFKSFK